MTTDIQIAREIKLKPINDIGRDIGLLPDELEPYGRFKGKVSLGVLDRLRDRPDGRLILVTSINPTPAGEGKTTITIGLGQSLNRLGYHAMIALREPSLGPCMGRKGGAAGGGHAQVMPMEDINLHFNGDIPAVSAANNLLAALLDNHIHRGNELGVDVRRVLLKRAIDMNDRALRHIVVGLGGPGSGIPREDGFTIAVASEVMAILCLATGIADLKDRLGRMVVAYSHGGRPITASDLKAQGAMAVLLKDALKPNLVQTLEHTPAFVHGGPFANIAHGCNSLVATRMGLKLADYLITEAGFGADLGAEKFINIKCRYGKLRPDGAVLVLTARALKHHGSAAGSTQGSDGDALEAGFGNMEKHLENLQKYGLPVVVAVNRFPGDTEEELFRIIRRCEDLGFEAVVADVYARGGAGGEDLARAVVDMVDNNHSDPRPLYELDAPVKEKIEILAREVYGARKVIYSREAETVIARLASDGLEKLPVCMAKSPYSLTDDPKVLGRPEGFRITVRDIVPAAGAGFLVVLTGNVLTMPGLPPEPAAEAMDIDDDGNIKGLF